MVFSSIEFLFFFLPIFMVAYFCAPKKAKNYVLLFFSLFFYAWGEPKYVFLMVAVTLSDWIMGLFIDKFREKKIQKLFLVLSVVIDLSALAYFKYADFFLGSINSVFKTSLPLLHIALPIGISFFIFQSLSYTIDLYKGECQKETNYFRYLTYVSMFPQLVAGPIVRFQDVQEALKNRDITTEKIFDGGSRFLKGLFKKVLLANQLGSLYDYVIALNPDSQTVLVSWLGAIAFTLQLYLDFSAYSDMAIGMGLMMGFKFPENFKHPLCAVSITDFWRRWHISLSTWFRDYVYIPLGGNRVSVMRHIGNMFAVWFLTGLWHGASWNFVLWGLMYFVLLVSEKYLWKDKIKKLPVTFSHIRVIFLTVIGFTLFSIDNVSEAFSFIGHMFNVTNGFVGTEFMALLVNYGAVLLVSVFAATPVFVKFDRLILQREDSIAKTYSVLKNILIVILMIITVGFLVADTYNPFLYFRF